MLIKMLYLRDNYLYNERQKYMYVAEIYRKCFKIL